MSSHAHKKLAVSAFVIAIGTYMMDSDRWHARNAMYGQLAIKLDPNGSPARNTSSAS